ncbi:hypothetical protein N7495_004856 [Penicillium taxi]|uniref:uncharacterized protein n=1 Tax=Penicillium taxi TaxID=168475 RepID=UPI002545A91F|nr:uncharacterized protein N7495_004856 [Penicillium taxi]KAJ5900112.1 hypothetical protein N7495_004856 [Penicillium taxi]
MAGSYSKTPSRASSTPKTNSTKRNASILSFFQKTDTPPGATSSQSRMTQFVTSTRSSGSARPSSRRRTFVKKDDRPDDLFLEDKKGLTKSIETSKNGQLETEDIWGAGDDMILPDDTRFNENSPVKRQKVDSSSISPENRLHDPASKPTTPAPTRAKKSNGPFIDESDSEEEDLEAYKELNETSYTNFDTEHNLKAIATDDSIGDPHTGLRQPPSVRKATIDAENEEESPNFDDLEEDEFLGEEFRERPWELEEQEENYKHELNATSNNEFADAPTDIGLNTCPICPKDLTGLTETEIAIHVNDCLDSKTTTEDDLITSAPVESAQSMDAIKKKLSRAERAAIARPAQRDPYSQNAAGERSAFSKMMAGNAEDTAWANAAANEVSSRGKQAYQRSCPFYKIMPGFSICVDAFRYGAVEGCKAYFLSHFHSDHYIGLTKSWCHGPIYCSKATANLVRQQLRVDPKWLVDLEFETSCEVPDTGGVRVTMIPANHCPGSSLFLFDKTFGKGPDARQQRILHCGDFRASKAHVQHPLLRPDPVNAVTGKPRQQKIDKCYLDTTYLNPKYAFPDQVDVINAACELCVRLNEEAGVGIDQGKFTTGLMNKFLSSVTGTANEQESKPPNIGGRLLVVIGTYSIGKERICIGIAKALKSKIFATPQKRRICACLEDAELTALLTSNPQEAQVHMQSLFEIRADTLADYLDSLKPHFSRVVGFRPTGWSYRPPAGRMLDNPPVSTVLRGEQWNKSFTSEQLIPQRGSTRESSCFGVPYSEHSSFRELTMFCCALRIDRIIPTVNVGSQKSRDMMKLWIDRWEAEKKRNGLFPVNEW